MRISGSIVVSILFCGAAHGAELSASSQIESVVVFPQGAEVTRVAKVKLEQGEHTIVFGDIPAQAAPHSIRIEGKATGKLEIGSVDSRRLFVPRAAAEGERKRLEDEIERLRDQRAVAEGLVKAAETQKTLIGNLAQLPLRPPQPPGTAPGSAREDWNQILTVIGTSMGEAQRALVEAQARIRDTDRKIEDLQKKLAVLAPAREERTEVRVFVNAASALEADLSVRYQVAQASWSPLYDARLTSGAKTVAPKLVLTRRAAISQRTGESWNDVALTLSTTRPAAGASAPELRTITIDFQPEPKPKVAASPPPPAGRSVAPVASGLVKEEGAAPATEAEQDEKRRVEAVQATVETAPFQALFTVPGRLTVPETGEVKRVQLSEEAIEPQLLVRTVPKLDAKAYLYAKLVVPKAAVALLPGSVSLFRDGTFVGAGRLPLLAPGEEHELGFGGDDLVRVRHAVADEKRAETGLISSSLTDQRSFRITVKNMHERPMQLVLLDQMPVSQNQDIKVELTGRSAPTKRDVDGKRGILLWETKLDPDEERVIEFGYRVTWPAQKAIVYGP